MTDLPRDDELASAYLDGETTAEERTRVEADPVLLARVSELDVVRAAVRAEVPAPAAEARDRAISAAIAASAAPLDELAEVRARRSAGNTPWIKIAGIAAAVLLAVASIPLLSRLGDGSKKASELAVNTTAQPNKAADAAAGASGEGVFAAKVAGDYATADELANAVVAQLNAPAPSTTAAVGSDAGAPVASSASGAPACDNPPAEKNFQSHIVFATDATVRGAAVSVAVYERPDGTRELVITDQSCAVLLSRPV